MIRYALVCRNSHAFESWFENSAAYDKQAKRGLVSCPICGDLKIEKAIMSPKIASGGKRGEAAPPPSGPEAPNAASPSPGAPPPPPTPPPADAAKGPVALVSPQEREFRQKLKELREHLTRNADYVGQKFPEVARKMHYGEMDHRSIYGEASPQQAQEMHEEGIQFHPLPVLPEERN